MTQNAGGYGQAPGGYGQAPGGYAQAQGGYGGQQGGFGGGAAAGAAYQVLTVDGGCGGVIDHSRIADLTNQMAGQGYALDQLFIDVRSVFGPFCMKRCAVLVFKRG
ncbi:hypothetical protein [Chondromyces apiculatus]|uniref:Putative PROLINE AND GLYCINE RICH TRANSMEMBRANE PROTEIN n=1 Tax=Chondromyces apiculatus DSM 436 TaxID=1192034 RepID=A0A017T790_9BACT|nr:hypothetical protein [Chondromyces apiculatus]EYF04877.1 putative PROLINE AND GLYCINE RICH TRANSMEMBRANE PROTEIN [Chondromyces apiculatus DSM 436]